ncbi:twisted gastrulation protein homolog 1-A [Lampris incognitus]|uniref:twisted gastrulation protein homolog 1-A n=1 Tax=Lampris incognitus TaxID=2546036 RepID=UPI0024B62191|nr:twisted gastrulation protein homolog 1-A [Lampris incognitus]
MENGACAFKAPDRLSLCVGGETDALWTADTSAAQSRPGKHKSPEGGKPPLSLDRVPDPASISRCFSSALHGALRMRPGQLLLPASAALLFLLSGLTLANGCNKALCASDVSKCLIQELCQCRPSDGNCSCCKECMLCLGTLWEECCDCVGMCNPKNYSDSPATSKSTVEELHRPIPSLFRALTEGDAPINMMVVSFPVAEELSHHENLVSFLETLDNQHQNVSLPGNSIHASYDTQDNMCTVVYFDDCVSIRQCKLYCESMGGSKYRWFHNACCQCIGPECLDYGSKAVKCMNCLF